MSLKAYHLGFNALTRFFSLFRVAFTVLPKPNSLSGGLVVWTKALKSKNVQVLIHQRLWYRGRVLYPLFASSHFRTMRTKYGGNSLSWVLCGLAN